MITITDAFGDSNRTSTSKNSGSTGLTGTPNMSSIPRPLGISSPPPSPSPDAPINPHIAGSLKHKAFALPEVITTDLKGLLDFHRGTLRQRGWALSIVT